MPSEEPSAPTQRAESIEQLAAPVEARPAERAIASTAQALEGDPVSLYGVNSYGVNSSLCVSRSCQHHAARVQLVVQNLVYDKKVTVVYTTDVGVSWRTQAAHCLAHCSKMLGFERWGFAFAAL